MYSFYEPLFSCCILLSLLYRVLCTGTQHKNKRNILPPSPLSNLATKYETSAHIGATLKPGDRKLESGTGNRKPESGIQNVDAETRNRNPESGIHKSKKTSSSNSQKLFCIAFACKNIKRPIEKKKHLRLNLFGNKNSPAVKIHTTVITSEGYD